MLKCFKLLSNLFIGLKLSDQEEKKTEEKKIWSSWKCFEVILEVKMYWSTFSTMKNLWDCK